MRLRAVTGSGALEARSVQVRFQGVRAVDDVSLTLREGEIVGLIGPNGAGKTTFMNVLTGFQRCNVGSVWFGDTNISRYAPYKRARMGLGRTFQNVHAFRDVSVAENVEASGVAVGLSRNAAKERALAALQLLGLVGKMSLRAQELAHGEARKLGVARAVAMHPKYLLLDEPAAGLTEPETEELMDITLRIRGELGCGVLIIEHYRDFMHWEGLHGGSDGAPLGSIAQTEIDGALARIAYLRVFCRVRGATVGDSDRVDHGASVEWP